MTTPIAAVFFLGQGGYLFSSSWALLAERVKATGVDVAVYPYTQSAEGARWLTGRDYYTGKKHKLAACGYSLGVSAATFLQASNGTLGGIGLDLLVSVAPSTLADNFLVNHNKTERSVLFYGTDFLSSAGQHDGYDAKFPVTAGFGVPVFSHLMLPASPVVINGVLAEFASLQKGN
jgi:hypothetical protein